MSADLEDQIKPNVDCPVCAEWETQYDAAMEHIERLRVLLSRRYAKVVPS